MKELEGGSERSTRVLIRPAATEDVETISRLETALYTNPWRPETFRSLLHRNRARVLVAEYPTKGVVGYAVFWWVLDQAELANLAVAGEFQGRGIGRALLDRVLLIAEGLAVHQVFLEVRWSNEPALRLYKGRGFSQISVRRGYYQNPSEDARILVLDLDGASADPGKERGEGSRPAP
jgi:ribosomal-protein-alanine N-acetyltransferase